MANETFKQPLNQHGPRIWGDRSDPGVPNPSADTSRSEDAPTGISERLQEQKEGRHIPATDADGKPYGHDWDPDSHEKGRTRTGGPGNEI